MRPRRGRRWFSLALAAVLALAIAQRVTPRAASSANDVTALPDTVALWPMRPQAAAPRVIRVDAVAARPEMIPTTAPAAERELATATLAFVGDILLHSPLVQRAHANAGGDGFDFTPMFARVAPLLGSVDAAVCHLETPIAPVGEELSTYPAYGVPADIAPALVAGFDRCSTASNHTMDRGVAGIDATVTAFEAAGLSQSGMARTEAESTSTLLDLDGIIVAHLSYTEHLNGLSRPADEPWRTNLIDGGRIVEDARTARASGAQIVIVSLHWGTEGRSEVDEQQREIAAMLASSGQVDLIIGHHAHVIQPIERINGVWVVFGLGNFLSNMPTGDSWPKSTQDGAIVEITISEMADGTFTVKRPRVIPTWVDRAAGWIIRPVTVDLSAADVNDRTKTALEVSLERTSAVVGSFVVLR